MKALGMFAAGLFLVSVPTIAQIQNRENALEALYFGPTSSYKTPYLEQAARNYAQALKSTNNGVVESAIAFSAYLRISSPGLDLRDIRRTITDLSENGRTPVIRYKAYLATVVFDSPMSFAGTLNDRYTDSDQFFTVVASQVHRTLLGHNLK